MVAASGGEGGLAAPLGVIVNGHKEGPLLAHTLESLAMARQYAIERGCDVDVYLVLDRSDAETRAVAERFRSILTKRLDVDFGNLGTSREAGLAAATNEWIAFLDGDDLISRNWLYDAYRYARGSEHPRDTVFHTEMFVGFGADVFFRRALRSTDPEFDPLCLIADWFFCNNLFAHRSIFERCPIEPYDHAKGIGPEDWHWSCKTTEAGIGRDYVPNTIYFYRMKPVSQSLGMSGGLVHNTSKLFTPETVRALAKQRAARGLGESSSIAPAPDTPRLRREAPAWVVEHALDQSSADAQLVEVARFIENNPAAARTFPPRMHYGVAEFYRRTAPRLLAEKGKIALFWGGAPRIGGAHLLPRMIECLREQARGKQIVVFAETGSLAAEALDAATESDVVVLDYSAARSKFQIPEVYLAMLTARYFLQFDFARIINVGSRAFDEVITRFGRTIAHRCSKLAELAPFVTFDRVDPDFDRIVNAMPHRRQFEHRLVCLSETSRDFFRSASLGAADVVFDKRLRASVKDTLRVRWSGDRVRMASAYEAVDFSALMRARRGARPERVGDGSYRDIAVVALVNGVAPELAAVYNAAKSAGASLHLLTPKGAASELRDRTAAAIGVSVHPLSNWTLRDVQEVVQNIDATWIAVLEPGVVITAQFLDQGIERLRQYEGRGVVIPEAVMRKRGSSWELLEFNEGRIGVEGEHSVLFGGLDPVGAAMFCPLRASAASSAMSDTASASAFAGMIALRASRSKALRVAQRSLAVNLLGEPWSDQEWVRMLKAPPLPLERSRVLSWWQS